MIDGNDHRKFLWFLEKYFKTEKLRIGFIVLLILLGSSIGNLSPLLYGRMLDSILEFNLNYLLLLILIYFIVTIGTTLLSLLEDYAGKMISFKIVKVIQKDLFDKMIRLKSLALDKYTTGELLSRVNGDCEGIVSFCLNVITSFLHIAINLTISIYFVIKISTHLSSVAIFYIPASIIVTIMARRSFKRIAEENKRFYDRYFSFLNEVFANNMGIKSFRLEKFILDKFDYFISKEKKILKKSILLGGIVQIFSTLITVISSLFIIYLSAVLIKNDMLTIGTMVSFNTYINKLFASVSQILGLNISKQEVMVSIDRIISLFSEESEAISENEERVTDKSVCIRASEICFSYRADNGMAIDRLSFTINSPGFYSFVGKNGCGKSTLAKLLIKLYDVDSGELEVNGVEYKNASIKSIRDNITYIQKEDFFLNDTIYNNLLLANEAVTEEEVFNACRIVGIHEFIDSLPTKYETLVGEGGATLSSGQKQKLNMARAVLKNSKIFIFDETTANLDGKAERDIINLLKEISSNSIVIFISHKLSSIEQSDKIFLMENGRIIDSGTHWKLYEDNLSYQELFKNSNSFTAEPIEA